MTEKIRKTYTLTPAKAHKYHAKRTNGYASAREATRAAELRLLVRAGKISNLQEQVRFTLLPAIEEWGYPRPLEYVADFTWIDCPTGKGVVADAKGFPTPAYLMKKRLMRQLLGIEVVEL